MPQPQDEFRKGLSLALRLGTEMVACVLVGTFLGFLLDRYLETKPWLTVVGLVIGAIAGFRNVYRASQQMNSE